MAASEFEDPARFVGNVATLRSEAWRKTQDVRIDAFELAEGICTHRPRCLAPESPHVWFWARYS